MPMTDVEIQHAIAEGDLVIENWDESAQEPASYDLRIGAPLQKGGEEGQIVLSEVGTATIRAGEFFVFRTHEKLRLCNTISGHLGAKSYFIRRGLILLCGQHIDPGFGGYLLMGAYNASPRDVIVRYLDKICNVEFHRLLREPTKTARQFPELQDGTIPRDIRDYFMGIEPVSVYSLSQSIAALADNVGALTRDVNTLTRFGWYFTVPVLTAILVAVIVRFLIGG